LRTDINAQLREKLRQLPRDPGCYMMKNSLGKIIYVGKAKSLKTRVAHYFVPAPQLDTKTRVLSQQIYDVEVIITQTPLEALLLERTLIKHHRPQFNVLLRDDKEYPYLRIDFKDTWPRIERVRRRRDDGATYLGPFGSAGQLRLLLDAAYRIFPLIRCSRHEFAHARRPCNYYHMKMCLGQCNIPVDPEVYKSIVQSAVDFIAGRSKEVARLIEEKMAAAATAENFELAAIYRDQLKAFESVTEKQSVVTGDVDDADIFACKQNETRISFHVLTVRDGKLIGGDSFVLNSPVQNEDESLTAFLLQYYDGRSLPGEIIIPRDLEDAEDLRNALLAGHPEAAKLILRVPQRGVRLELVAIALKNAEYRLTEIARLKEKVQVELRMLQEHLGLRRLPQRMECIDISNIQGTAIVASNVCFVDGRPAKEFYRHYVITEVTGSPDDFASINEVVRRRLARAERDGDLPDLLIIDGGKGQLSAASDARAKFPDLDFELISLAKSRIDKRGRRGFIDTSVPERSFERVFFPDREVAQPLAQGTPEFRLLTQIRDEAHRFAITHHRQRRGKLSHASDLEDIPGIGPTLRKTLLTTFGGLDGLKQASLAQLKAIKGLREASAVALFSYFRSSEDDVGSDSEGEPESDSDPASTTK